MTLIVSDCRQKLQVGLEVALARLEIANGKLNALREVSNLHELKFYEMTFGIKASPQMLTLAN